PIWEVDDEFAVLRDTSFHKTFSFVSDKIYHRWPLGRPRVSVFLRKAEHPAGVGGGLGKDRFGRHSLALGDVLTHIGDQGAVAPGAPHRLGGHVGAVGL